MAEPYAQYLEGVPNVSTSSGPSVFSSSAGMSPRQRNFLTADQMRGQSVILEAQERIAALKDREASRVQGRVALDALSGLDPMSDPDYDRKVMGVLAKNPSATLDQTVSNFLGVQGSLFEKAQTERERIEEEARQKIIDRERSDETLRREDARIRQEVGLRRDLEAEEMIASLPTPLISKFDEYRTKGLDQRTALKRTMEDAEGEAEINELRALGLDDMDIEGLNDPITGEPLTDPSTGKPIKQGLLDPKTGRVDPARKATLIGERARQDAERKQKSDSDKLVERRINLLTRQLQSLDPTMENYDSVSGTIQTAIGSANEQLGLLTPKVEEATVGAEKKKSPDVLPSDRFLP